MELTVPKSLCGYLNPLSQLVIVHLIAPYIVNKFVINKNVSVCVCMFSCPGNPMMAEGGYYQPVPRARAYQTFFVEFESIVLLYKFKHNENTVFVQIRK